MALEQLLEQLQSISNDRHKSWLERYGEISTLLKDYIERIKTSSWYILYFLKDGTVLKLEGRNWFIERLGKESA
jgi:hypothetical protein